MALVVLRATVLGLAVLSASIYQDELLLLIWCRLVHTAPMEKPPTPEKVRFTITTTPDVHAVFTRLSKATSTSLSAAVGEWLADTLDAATQVTLMVERAREAPRLMSQQINAFALGLADETGELMRSIAASERSKGGGGRVAASDASQAPQAASGRLFPEVEVKAALAKLVPRQPHAQRAAGEGSAASGTEGSPPSSNTGGKVPKRAKVRGGATS